MFSSKIVKNSSMLMLMNIARIGLPFVTLPYLTRVLSTDSYGVVAYINAVMTYMQVFVDFGFNLSGTKEIVSTLNDENELCKTVSEITIARIIVGGIAFLVMLILVLFIPILKQNLLFTFLSFGAVFISVFLFDFVFRGLEEMQIITLRFVIMKIISTFFTFIFIKSDSQILYIPILNISSSLIAIVLVIYELKKRNIKYVKPDLKNIIKKIKESCVYFLSNVASTSFNAFSTVISGFFLSPTEIAFFSISMQIVTAIQMFYNPISDAVYPEMIKSKNISFIFKMIFILQPIIFIGCICSYIFAKFGMKLIGGDSYIEAANIFRCLIPVIFFSFPAILLGWPSLGAINKIKQTSISTICTVIVQILFIVVLILIDKFSIFTIAILRSFSEFLLFSIRFILCMKYKKEFIRVKI